MDGLRSFIESSAERFIEELVSFLTIPSVSALPAHAADIRRCAEWTARALERSGLQNVRLIETNGHPVVYAEWLGAVGMPTVLCYGHYDVQPVDPVDLWDSPPFAPTVKGGRLYARGASDNKGQIFMHLKGIEAHLRTVGKLPVNVRVMVEGEEEVGGGNVAQFVQNHRDLLGSDVVVISDGAMFARGVPSICRALRGIVYFEIAVHGPANDLHSGSCGGAVANPALALARILAGLVDGEGRITIPGFYDNVRELSATERSALAMLPFSEEQYLADLRAPQLHGEPGFSLLERLWTRPTCDVNGLQSGYTGPGTKTIIPAMAIAKVSMRLVPDQDPDRIASLVEKHVRNIASSTVDVEFRTVPGGGRPWVASHDTKFMDAAVCAIEKTFGTPPVFTREGGSNGAVTIFQDTLKAPIILLDLGLPDDNPHAPNEKLDIEQLFHGITVAAQFYEELSHVQFSA